MQLVKPFLILMILATLFACQSKSPIVTSKNEAIKRGMYDTDQKRRTTASPQRKEVETNDKVLYATTVSSKEAKTNSSSNKRFSDNSEINNLILTAFEYEGVRYRGGGTTNEGMDCSGLVFRTFITHDIKLPRSSYEMATVGRKLKHQDIRPGDLVFFKTNGRSRINHVGLVTEVRADEILFIHSSTQRGVIVSSTKEPYYSKSFTQANRIIE